MKFIPFESFLGSSLLLFVELLQVAKRRATAYSIPTYCCYPLTPTHMRGVLNKSPTGLWCKVLHKLLIKHQTFTSPKIFLASYSL